MAACEAAKEAVWLQNFLMDLEVVPDTEQPMTLFCDNSGAVAVGPILIFRIFN